VSLIDRAIGDIDDISEPSPAVVDELLIAKSGLGWIGEARLRVGVAITAVGLMVAPNEIVEVVVAGVDEEVSE